MSKVRSGVEMTHFRKVPYRVQSITDNQSSEDSQSIPPIRKKSLSRFIHNQACEVYVRLLPCSSLMSNFTTFNSFP